MQSTPDLKNLASSQTDISSRLDRLRQTIDRASELLPAQGPIGVFIHHNTLHAFEHLPFHDALVEGAKTFACSVYLPEDRFREFLARGRMGTADLEAVLREELGERADESICGLSRRIELRMAMLQYPLRLAPSAELRWFVAETDALRRVRTVAPAGTSETMAANTRAWVMNELRPMLTESASASDEARAREGVLSLLRRLGIESIDRWNDSTWVAVGLQSMWRMARDGVHSLPSLAGPEQGALRHRDLLLEAGGTDADGLVHELLVRFCAAFLDQGFATCPLAHRERGFLQAFNWLYGRGGNAEPWLGELPRELRRWKREGLGALEAIADSLDRLGVPEAHWESYLTRTLLALRGWAGMIRQMELRADRVARPVPPGSVVEFLAVRLLLDRLAAAHLARTELGVKRPISELQSELRRRVRGHETPGVDQRAFLVFQLAQVLGWWPPALARLSKSDWSKLVAEIEAFPPIERRRVFQLAFERRYRHQTLDAIQIAAEQNKSAIDFRQPGAPTPRFQLAVCIDDREESLRRHVEELSSDAETFGVVGFFNVAMYYRGAAEAHFGPLCPISVVPQVWVQEEVVDSLADVHRRRAKVRRMIGALVHRLHLGSRTAAGGLVTASMGLLATIPLVARILVPRLTAQLRRTFGHYIQPPPVTNLQLVRSWPEPGDCNGHIGLSLEEMAAAGESMLRDMGLTSNFAPWVFMLGHGSSSLNNPHNSAYNCGACGGAAGGPNGRAIARILNDARVRFYLAERGISIPDSTVFVGGYHNTCDDSVTYYDVDRIPLAKLDQFKELRAIIEEACNRNAHERCRRFRSAPLGMTFEEARQHVEERCEDLAQTRPECGHATNAVCFVGRRSKTRGLFMDRRTFLISYQPEQDTAEGAILERLLQAGVPVCAGINLEYYFSYVDPTGWGCGTKLPHNVASLLGVMDGPESDLRTGLPWQMVEIHEPVRLLFVVEATVKLMSDLLERNASISRLCHNEWVQLATLNPETNEVHVLVAGKFVRYQRETEGLPRAASSVDWYRGSRDHLGYALIGSASAG